MSTYDDEALQDIGYLINDLLRAKMYTMPTIKHVYNELRRLSYVENVIQLEAENKVLATFRHLSFTVHLEDDKWQVAKECTYYSDDDKIEKTYLIHDVFNREFFVPIKYDEDSDTYTCNWCDADELDESDGVFETDMGFLCDNCYRALTSRGESLSITTKIN